MWFQQIILVLFTCSFVFGEEPFNHDFGDNFNDVFRSGCGGLRPWIQANYDTTSVNPPNPDSPQFVKPDTTSSCILSETFSMSNEGQLQLNVYLKFTSQLDQIRVSAFTSQYNVYYIIGEIYSSLDHPHNNSAWNTLSVTIAESDRPTDEPFDGFVVITGSASSNSYILVDRIQYFPPGGDCDGDNCESEQTPCFYYDFYANFGYLFKNKSPICANTETWVRINSNEASGIVPSGFNSISCISSLYIPFNKGSLTVTLLIKSDSYFDSITVLLNNDHNVLQSTVFGKLTHGNITSELYTLEIPVDYEGEAQITFTGFATEGATVLVDSFKYTPSNWNGEDCIVSGCRGKSSTHDVRLK